MRSIAVVLLGVLLGIGNAQAGAERSIESEPIDPVTVTFCRDAESLIPDSAVNDFSPVSDAFLRQIGAHHGHTIEELKPYHVTLVAPPQYGQVQLTDAPSHGWTYAPAKGYTGADRVVYQVETQGKRYKVIVNFWVVEITDENRTKQVCDSINFGASNGTPQTLSWLKPIPMSDFEADTNWGRHE